MQIEELLLELYNPDEREFTTFAFVDSLTKNECKHLVRLLQEEIEASEYELIDYIRSELDEGRVSGWLSSMRGWRRFEALVEEYEHEFAVPPRPISEDAMGIPQQFEYHLYCVTKDAVEELIRLRESTLLVSEDVRGSESHSDPESDKIGFSIEADSAWRNMIGMMNLVVWCGENYFRDFNWNGPISVRNFSGIAYDILEQEWMRFDTSVDQIPESVEKTEFETKRSQLSEAHGTCTWFCIWMHDSSGPNGKHIRDEPEILHQKAMFSKLRTWLESIPDNSETERQSSRHLKPKWDAEVGTLWYGENLIRTVRLSAHTVLPILDAFEKAGWPRRIDSPFDNGAVGQETHRLAIKSLNKGLRLLRFRADGSGKGTIWEFQGELTPVNSPTAPEISGPQLPEVT